MLLRILHIQYWDFEPKDCIPTFPFISPVLTRGFDAAVVDGWLADLVTIEQRNSSFFSLNRYFFSAEKGEG